MQITITKGTTDDLIEARRADGSSVSTRLPKKGPIPHDAVHYWVERELGVAQGFWGMVAGGCHPEDVQEIAKAAGHASAGRPQQPDPSIIPIVQVERVVECFEADLWGGGADGDTFRDMVRSGCEQSLVPVIHVSDEAIARIRSNLAQLRDDWSAMPVGGTRSFDWPEERAAA